MSKLNRMYKYTLLKVILISVLTIINGLAQIPALPDNYKTKWIVSEPEELVSYLIYDQATVKERIPSFLRIITVGELAASNISWAKEHLNKNPNHESWGIGFIEIVRAKIFEIDGLSPKWPENGAMALWCARVAPADSGIHLGSGQPYLALELLLSDSLYVNYMRDKGYYAGYGDVHLSKKTDSEWVGTIATDDLHVRCRCIINQNSLGNGSFGTQVIFPPAQSGINDFIHIAFAGHKINACDETSKWVFNGTNPLTKVLLLGESSFQYGYELVGKTYSIDLVK